MSDLCIREADGWIEIDDPFTTTDEIWSAAGVGDDATIQGELWQQGFWFASPGSDGDDHYEGEIMFRLISTPDDMLGRFNRLWFKPADRGVELWSAR